ncbi:MAG: DUF1501 domain-containing protein [Planctomycetota bacterium]
MTDPRKPSAAQIRRRDLAKLAGGCAALTNTSLLSTLFSLSATNAATAAEGNLTGYKAIICLFMFGGNDSFNTLSPLSTAERADYLEARGGVYAPGNGALGLPEEGLHSITDSSSGRQFAIHPDMPEMKELYDNGKLTFLCNVGSLVEPTTMQEYQARTNLPLGLFSHADLQRHWMTSVPQTRSQVDGWAGRMADVVNGTTNTNPTVSMNIAIDNVNMLQTGSSVVPYVIDRNGAREVQNYNQPWTRETIYRTLNDDALSRSYGNLIEKTFAQVNRNSIDAAVAFNEAVNIDDNPVDAHFPTENLTRLQENLRIVARAIRAQETLGQQRQIFFVSDGGYDNHDELINNQSGNMSDVSQSLKNFQDAIDAIGMTNDVVLFTASDFARTLNSNGRGSDHAWGGNQLIMGGPVAGGRLHGTYPESLAPGNELDLGRGRLLPTTSVDEMACELAMWYGLPNDGSMPEILPNIRNFVGAGTDYPIGFLG